MNWLLVDLGATLVRQIAVAAEDKAKAKIERGALNGGLPTLRSCNPSAGGSDRPPCIGSDSRVGCPKAIDEGQQLRGVRPETSARPARLLRQDQAVRQLHHLIPASTELRHRGTRVTVMRWDNITILQAVDRLQQQYGGGELRSVDGRELMDNVAGAQVTDDGLVRGFVLELEIAAYEGYLTYRIGGNAEQMRHTMHYQYLQRITTFALTVKGQDRARGIRVVQPLPNPAEDDGRAISALILQQIASVIAKEYTPRQILVFLREGGAPLDRLPLPAETPEVSSDPGSFVYGVLIGLDQWGSEGRRILREFIGSWLDDRLNSGPPDELRIDLIEKLARRGWYVVDGNLIIGDPAKGKRVRSPILRDARLAALHPEILAVAERLFRDEHRAAAVFEAAKAVHNRVKKMTGLSGDGTGLMSSVFKDEQPALVIADLTTQTGRDVQTGYRFLFMGSQQAIRNPAAHEQFGEMGDDEAFELLGLASHLMRKLDEAIRAKP
jgi:uncharacterized protein (TIGR02391 family)